MTPARFTELEKILIEWCNIIDSMPAGSTPVTEGVRELLKAFKNMKRRNKVLAAQVSVAQAEEGGDDSRTA